MRKDLWGGGVAVAVLVFALCLSGCDSVRQQAEETAGGLIDEASQAAGELLTEAERALDELQAGGQITEDSAILGTWLGDVAVYQFAADGSGSYTTNNLATPFIYSAAAGQLLLSWEDGTESAFTYEASGQTLVLTDSEGAAMPFTLQP